MPKTSIVHAPQSLLCATGLLCSSQAFQKATLCKSNDMFLLITTDEFLTNPPKKINPNKCTIYLLVWVNTAFIGYSLLETFTEFYCIDKDQQ